MGGIETEEKIRRKWVGREMGEVSRAGRAEREVGCSTGTADQGGVEGGVGEWGGGGGGESNFEGPWAIFP